MSSGLFCDVCGTLLVSHQTPGNNFKFQCMRCKKERDATTEDTLRFEERKTNQISKYSTILKNITEDPMNLKAEKKCPKCKHTIVKQVRLGELTLVNGCLKCKHRWVGD